VARSLQTRKDASSLSASDGLGASGNHTLREKFQMSCRKFTRLLMVLGLGWCFAGLLQAQVPQGRPDRDKLIEPVHRQPFQVAQSPSKQSAQTVVDSKVRPAAASEQPSADKPASSQEHPLAPALKLAYSSLKNIEANVKDYTCTLIKRERIGDKLGEQEFMFVKIRHEPFSAYTYFLGPDRIKGQEAIYVEGQNNNELQGHGVGIKKIAGTVSLKPNSMLAMQGQRYPITEIGILNLTRRLVEVGQEDMKYGECEVKFFNGTKIKLGNEQRSTTMIQVVHPVPRRNFRFHMARIYVDDQLNMPIRYEAYDWPVSPKEKPPLLEEYTYSNIKLNQGLTDSDFDVKNPNYGF
jgi:hypothetical protein